MRNYRSTKILPATLLAIILILTALFGRGELSQAGAASGHDDGHDGETVTVLVQLEGEPLARFLGNRLRDAMLDPGPRKPIEQALQSLAAPDDRPAHPDETIGKHLQALETRRAEFERTARALAPQMIIRARFDTVLNGVAVTLPAAKAASLAKVPGVKSVSETKKFRPILDGTIPMINSTYVWSQLGGASNAGLGQKIAIVDTGIDHRHFFLTDDSLVPPPGYPRGDLNYTTNKIIVAKTYPPPGRSFSPEDSNGHGTHVAGIAAGVNGASGTLSGVAPKAYLMNYNVFGDLREADTTEIVRAIEDAVKDGADVVNLSLGGSASGLENDPLVTAVRNGITAGVVFAIAAGNSGSSWSTITTPGITPEAITVGASTKRDSVAFFSSRGPNIDLSIKPDVVAPGESVFSSRPDGRFTYLSGTSMAAPHVAGAAALLRQAHPEWNPLQVKSALVNTAVFTSTTELATATVSERGAGRIDLRAAAEVSVTVDPPLYSFGVYANVANGPTTNKQFTVKAQPDGGGTWTLSAHQTTPASGLKAMVSTPSLTLAPNGTATFNLAFSAANSGAEPYTNFPPLGDYEGYVTLTKGDESVRVPYWIRLVGNRTLLLPVFKNATTHP